MFALLADEDFNNGVLAAVEGVARNYGVPILINRVVDSRSLPLLLREITPDTPSAVIVPSRPDAPLPTVRPLETDIDVRRDSEA